MSSQELLKRVLLMALSYSLVLSQTYLIKAKATEDVAAEETFAIDMKSIYNIQVTKIDMDTGDLIGPVVVHEMYSGNIAEFLKDLGPVQDFEPRYHNLDREMNITVYHKYVGPMVTIKRVDLEGNELANSTRHRAPTGNVFNVKETAQPIDAFKAKYYTIGDQEFSWDEQPTIMEDTEITIHYSSTLLSVDFPENMDFFVTAETAGKVESNDYVITNESEIPIALSFTELHPTELDGVELVSEAKKPGELYLNLDINMGHETQTIHIMPHNEGEKKLGVLEVNGEATLSLSGNYVGTLTETPIRPQVELVFTFEAAE